MAQPCPPTSAPKPPPPKPKLAVDPALAARFAADLAALIGAEAAATARLGIAVSGGPDSLALLLLAAAACPGRIAAATVDHGLRPESAAEAAAVARIAADLGVPHAILLPSAPITGSLQAAARTARYAALHDWRTREGLDWLLTAHHADDQRETFFMRLTRSSGVGGLAGIRRRAPHLLRPLLHWRRAELAAVVTDAGYEAADDPSNRDSRFDRAAMRAALAGFDAVDAVAAARSADALADADAALDWMAARHFAAQLPSDAPDGLLWESSQPIELKRRLLLRWLAATDPNLAPRGEQVMALVTALDTGQPAMIGTWRLLPPRPRESPHWRIVPAPPPRR